MPRLLIATNNPGKIAEFRRVLAAHAEYVQGETLSLSLVESEPPPNAHRSEQTVDGHRVVLGVLVNERRHGLRLAGAGLRLRHPKRTRAEHPPGEQQ